MIHPLEQPLRTIPPLPALLAFERAATQLSFRRAARDLSLSPSAISHQIASLGASARARTPRARRLTIPPAFVSAAASGMDATELTSTRHVSTIRGTAFVVAAA